MTRVVEPELLHAPIIALNSDTKDKAAFVTEDETLSYSQLRKITLQGSKWLRESGCRRGDCIGICLPKSIDTVEIIFATLATGAIFLPIDINAPPARVAYLLSDAGASRLFTHPGMAQSLNQLGQTIASDITVLDDKHNFQNLLGEVTPDEKLPRISAQDTALLYYTSGTTGFPKAIILSHENVTSFTQWAISSFAINENDRIASHAPFHFDLSTLDLFAATRAGASVVLLDEASVKFPSKISQLIETTGITIWYSVPTALVQLLRHGVLGRRNLDALRLILFAGEVFPVPELRKLMESLPNCEFVNLYGPTETNVCTYYRILSPPEAGTKDIPIGITCENLRTGLYQEDDTETPDGEIGELVVFGSSIMQGYLNQPELTEKSRLNGNEKSYRTGDFAYKDDNNLYHLVGRKDDQVKIRGHRFELMEITSVLTMHPEIMEAATLLSKPTDGEAEIVAFIVPEPNQVITAENVREHCGNFMPRYAVPKHVLILDTLPRTATGKIDRQTLMQYQNF